jgi:hypothetical protein
MHEKGLEPGLALLPLGNTDARQVVETQFGKYLPRDAMLALSTVDQDQVGARVSPVATFS